MEKYKIQIKKSAVKELEALPSKEAEKIVSRIRNLAADPRPPGSNKLSAREQYRLRSGHYRVIYAVLDQERLIHIIKIGHRKDVYQT